MIEKECSGLYDEQYSQRDGCKWPLLMRHEHCWPRKPIRKILKYLKTARCMLNELVPLVEP